MRKSLLVLLGMLLLILVLAALLFGNLFGKRYNYPLEYSQEVGRWAEEYELDPYLVYAVIKTESGFDPNAQSSAGAIGLMQMTRETFEWIKGKIAPQEDLAFEDLYQPDTSIRFGSSYLAMCLERYGGDISTAAAAYHSGWGTVNGLLESGEHSDNDVYLTNFPYRQMGHYVNKIQSAYKNYLELYVEKGNQP